MEDISDFYIKTSKFPGYDENRVINTAFEDVIVAKIEMILLTNKGECTDPNFGADVVKFLWHTRFPSSTIQQNIIEQFQTYIPELSPKDYQIKVYILKGKVQDIGCIQVDLGIKKVNALFK